jgi:plastocyanin
MSRKAVASLSAAVSALALTAIPAGALGTGQAAGTHTVTLHEHLFHPPTLSIKRGEKVRWLWRDGETEHNVTFRGFHSRTQASGSYTVRFTHSGTFHYFCTIHVSEGMKGKIVVH